LLDVLDFTVFGVYSPYSFQKSGIASLPFNVSFVISFNHLVNTYVKLNDVKLITIYNHIH